MKRIRLAIVAGAVAMCLTMATAAAARGARGPSGAAVPHGGSPVSSKRTEGRVQKIDASTRTLTLESGEKLTVGPSTQIVKDATTTSFDDIAVGDEVRASFLQDDPNYLLRLDVISGSGSTPAPDRSLPPR